MQNDIVWREFLTPVQLGSPGTEVHLWYGRLDDYAREEEPLAQLLSPDERERAGRFHFSREMRHFITARGLLRAMLGHYIGVSPEALQFSYGLYGKPALANSHSSDLRFSLAHSHGTVIYAIGFGHEIGVDIEWLRPLGSMRQIAERFFSAGEISTLRQLPEEAALEVFFCYWVRTEAYLKGMGVGLSLPFEQVRAEADGDTGDVLYVRDSSAGGCTWSARLLKPLPGYVAAVAVSHTTRGQRL